MKNFSKLIVTIGILTSVFSSAQVLSQHGKAELIFFKILPTNNIVFQTAQEQNNLQIYDEANMPLKTYYPKTMKVFGTGTGEGVGIFFTFKPQGNLLDKAEINFFLPKGSSTAADLETFVTGFNGLMENNHWQMESQTTDTTEFAYPWVKKIIHFSTNQKQSGLILLGESDNQAIQVILLYPPTMSQTYWSSVKTILENVQFKEELLPI